MSATEFENARIEDDRVTVLATEMASIKDLKPFHANARIGNVDLIAESLQVNGQYKALVVQVADAEFAPGEVLAGNHLLRAAQSLGWEQVLVSWVNVDEATARRIVVVDNRASDVASYDDVALAELLASIQDAEPDLDGLVGTGFTDVDLDALLAKIDKVSVEVTAHVRGAGGEHVGICEPGQSWRLGKGLVVMVDTGKSSVADVADVLGGVIANRRTGHDLAPLSLAAEVAEIVCRRYQEVSGDKPVLDSSGEGFDFSAH